jgi:DNA (cytosine-5)-methyltransferase 1
MRHGSLFSGIGGFDLAAEWMGWENVFHCEWMEFPRKVLEYHFPNADSLIDICKTDFKKYEGTIDIISGGFPCQPFSMAGKRKGTEDERYLWGEMLRAVQEIKPKFVIAENVFGITNIDGGLVFEQVCLDLETEGYEVQPFIIPAAAKNAPHRRDRCWFIGVRNYTDSKGARLQNERAEQQTTRVEQYGKLGGNVTNTNSNGLQQRNGNDEIEPSERGQYAQRDIESLHLEQPITQHTDLQRQKRRSDTPNEEITIRNEFSKRDARSSPTTDWQNFPTESPICGGDDGLPTELDGITFPKWRAESIKGYGNAIVPQIAYQLFQIIETL